MIVDIYLKNFVDRMYICLCGFLAAHNGGAIYSLVSTDRLLIRLLVF